ncbi:hypothetical protein VDGL01_12253 [Verticillium dahliae]
MGAMGRMRSPGPLFSALPPSIFPNHSHQDETSTAQPRPTTPPHSSNERSRVGGPDQTRRAKEPGTQQHAFLPQHTPLSPTERPPANCPPPGTIPSPVIARPAWKRPVHDATPPPAAAATGDWALCEEHAGLGGPPCIKG